MALSGDFTLPQNDFYHVTHGVVKGTIQFPSQYFENIRHRRAMTYLD
jgi:hypothetical protein